MREVNATRKERGDVKQQEKRLRRVFIRLAERKKKKKKRVQVNEETNGGRRCKIKESGDVCFFLFFFVTFVGGSFR